MRRRARNPGEFNWSSLIFVFYPGLVVDCEGFSAHSDTLWWLSRQQQKSRKWKPQLFIWHYNLGQLIWINRYAIVFSRKPFWVYNECNSLYTLSSSQLLPLGVWSQTKIGLIIGNAWKTNSFIKNLTLCKFRKRSVRGLIHTFLISISLLDMAAVNLPWLLNTFTEN